jgi:hypothetical protein
VQDKAAAAQADAILADAIVARVAAKLRAELSCVMTQLLAVSQGVAVAWTEELRPYEFKAAFLAELEVLQRVPVLVEWTEELGLFVDGLKPHGDMDGGSVYGLCICFDIVMY